VQRRFAAGKLDAPAGHRPVQQRLQHLGHYFHLQKVVTALALGLGKAYRTLEIAAIGDVDNGQARLILASHPRAAAAWAGWRRFRPCVGEDQFVPRFKPAVQPRIGEDQILAGRVASALGALVNLASAVEDFGKGWLAAVRAKRRDPINGYIVTKRVQRKPSKQLVLFYLSLHECSQRECGIHELAEK
jgi:hypothetical protein